MKNKNKAFTLIELLVTIVIIGILATISISTFNNYRRDAINARRQAELEQAHKKILSLCTTKELDMCNELNVNKLVADSSFTDPSFWNTDNQAYGPNHWVIEDGVAKNIGNTDNHFDFLLPRDEDGNSFQLPAGDYWMTMKVLENPGNANFGVVINHIVGSFYGFLFYGKAIPLGDEYFLINIQQNSDFYMQLYNTNNGDLIIDDVFFFQKN